MTTTIAEPNSATCLPNPRLQGRAKADLGVLHKYDAKEWHPEALARLQDIYVGRPPQENVRQWMPTKQFRMVPSPRVAELEFYMSFLDQSSRSYLSLYCGGKDGQPRIIEDIGDMVGLSKTTAWYRVSRAIEKLGRAIETGRYVGWRGADDPENMPIELLPLPERAYTRFCNRDERSGIAEVTTAGQLAARGVSRIMHTPGIGIRMLEHTLNCLNKIGLSVKTP